MRLADRVQAITPSPTIVLDTQAKAWLAQGKPVINLTAGELDFAVPEIVQQAVQRAAAEPTNRYSAVAGLATTRQAIVQYLWQQHQLQYQPEQIVVTTGAKQALFYCFQTLVNPGDEVLVLHPAWVSYSEQIKLAGGVPVVVETAVDFQPDRQQLEPAITDRTVGLVLNYPNNPTGAVYPPATVQALAAFAKQHQLWVISDEIYEQLVYDDTVFQSFGRVYPEAIIVNGISKAAAVTGWRLGYVAGPHAIIEAITTLQSHGSGNVSNVMQAAFAPGLLLPVDIRQQWLQTLHERRALIMAWVKQHPAVQLVPPAGAFYCFVDLRQLTHDSVAFCQELLAQAYVALVPGKYFGREGFVRLSFANRTALIQEALERLDRFISPMI